MKSKCQKVLDDVVREERKKEQEWQDRMRKYKAESNAKKKLAEEELYPRLRPAEVKDYLDWLKGYIENGGKPTHVYNYPFSRWDWYVATIFLKPIRLCGASAVNIIVPADIQVESGDWGHCRLFFMNGYKAIGSVPIFADTNFSDE